MKQFDFKKFLPHLAAIGIFLAINVIYFNPAFTGKQIQQGDLISSKGMRQEVMDFKEKTGEQSLWTNSMFSGMPVYLIFIKYPGNLFSEFYKVLSLWLPNPAKFIFLYMIGFYLMMIIMRVNPWLAITAAVAFSFSSYLIQIVEAGHSSKAHAIAYMAPLLGCFVLIFRKRYLLGGALFALFFTLELRANHLQITYYMGMVFLVFLLFKLYKSVQEKEIPHFVRSVLIMGGGVVIALLVNIGNIWGTYEYSKETIRGQSELTLEGKNLESGLDRDYITNWSYGIGETWNLLVPNFKGGSSSEPIGNNVEALTEVTPQFRQIVANIPQYFGDMPFTSGPYYIGAIVIFLFILALFLEKSWMKWAVVVLVILSLVLSWGKNMMSVTNFFIDYVPLYNKFRTVPMAQVIAELLIPFLGFLTLDRLIKQPELLRNNRKKVMIAAAIPLGILLLFYIAPTSFNSFIGDAEYERIRGQLVAASWAEAQMTELFDNIEVARIAIFKADVMRSLLFILAGAVVIWLFVINKLKGTYVLAAVAVLILMDQWTINRRYLNDDSFVNKRAAEQPFRMTQADQQILQDPDPHYRVLNLAVNTFNDASTSYFHKSVGGYHAAKLMRYQELIDYHISKNNFSVLNMLNTKYLISRDQNGAPFAQRNPGSLGNGWFVEDFELVENADAEIQALNEFDPASKAFIDKRFSEQVAGLDLQPDANANVQLGSYAPNQLTYGVNSDKGGMVIFSEIYYEKGWNAYIDGELAPHFRANYVLRGMVVPAGNHEIVFKFEPIFFTYSTNIAMVSSTLLILLLLGAGYKEFKGLDGAAAA